MAKTIPIEMNTTPFCVFRTVHWFLCA